MIVSCGEAVIDFLPRQAADGTPVFAPFAGGSPFNVAIAIGRLGVPAGFFGGLSTDLFGDLLRAALKAAGVDPGLANINDRPTTLAFVNLSGGDARYAFFDENSAGRMLAESDIPVLPKTVAALHFGSFSLAEEPCGSTLETFMRREFASRVISLDINVRSTLIRNRDGYVARLARLVAMADIVKLSEEDLVWLDPSASFEMIAHYWLERGAKIVVLTKGADGAVAATPAQAVITVPGIAAKVADTVGAGDTFTAAMLARLAQKQLLTKPSVSKLDKNQIADALTFATKAAAVTVSRPGADPPWLNELA